MHRSAIALLIATAAMTAAPGAGAAHANTEDQPLHLSHDWRISLDEGGRVAALHDSGELAPSVREPLENAIRQWSFEPGRVDGHPAPTETNLTLDVTFLPTGGERYAIRIDDARVGGALDTGSTRRNIPKMPADAARKPGLRARVVVRADYDSEGEVRAVEVQPDQGIASTRSLEAATIAAVKRWKIVPERVGGHGIASSVMVPVCYTVTQGWPRPEDFPDCTWTPQGSKSRVANGSAFALAPAAKLDADVIGHAL